MKNVWLDLNSKEKDFEFDLSYNGVYYLVNIKKINDKSFSISEISPNSVIASMINSGNFQINGKCNLELIIVDLIKADMQKANLKDLFIVLHATIFKPHGIIKSITFKSKSDLSFIKQYL